MKLTFEKILSIPKSLYVSLRLCPLKDAINIPILVRYNCKLTNLRGIVVGGRKTAILKIGFGSVGVFDKTYERSIIEIGGRIELDGKATFGHGSRICVTKGAVLKLGKNFCNTAMMTLVCSKKIDIGDNVLSSWNTLVMDTDWHNVEDILTHEVKPKEKSITIGDNVWLGTRSVILKGVQIADGCIIGANAVVTKQFHNPNTLIAGNPANEIKHNVALYR